MATMFVRHRVADFDAWKQIWDDNSDTRRQAGVTSEAVFRSAADPDEVTLMLDFATMAAAEAFPDNRALKDAYRQAGSIGEPAPWFAERV